MAAGRKTVAGARAKTKPKAKVKAEVKAKKKAETKAEVKKTGKTKAGAKTQVRVKKVKAEIKKAGKMKPRAEIKAETKKKTEARLKSAVKPNTEVRAKTAPARKAEEKGAQVSDRFRGLKNMLISKRDGILKEAKQEIAKYVSGENRQLVDTAIDEADWATVDISEDISLRRLAAHRQLLLDIEECLRKINEGTYGICEECGEEISEKRLNVIPTATLCIDCKEQRERMAVVEHETEM